MPASNAHKPDPYQGYNFLSSGTASFTLDFGNVRV